MTIKNSKTLPKVYYGLHMVEGVAEYKEPQVNDGNPYRIFIGCETIKNMDPTFQGKPVYVRHVNEVDLDKLQSEADGYVVKSFFNKCDGKHWCEFIVVSDKGHEAIRNGWKLSNAYVLKQSSGGGRWHGVDYVKEVTAGEYEHLALVPNPRYEESIILTPEEFKLYNSEKELELKKLANSKGEKSMFKFFKRSVVENAAELEAMSVTLPKSKKELPLAQIINEYDEHMEKAEKPQMANGEHHVEVGGQKMTVNELISKHLELSKAHHELKSASDVADKDAKAAEKKGEGEAAERKVEDATPAEDKAALEKTKELEEHEKKEIAEGTKKSEADKGKEEAEKKKNSQDLFDILKNAPDKAIKNEISSELSEDKVSRGKARYGSK